MPSRTAIPTPLMRAAWWLPCLLGGAAVVHAAAAAPSPAPATVATSYRVVNLGTGSISELPTINAHGQVAFSLFDPSGAHAWFYDGHTVQNIGTLGGPTASAVDLNDAGQVAGYADTPSGFAHAFRWSASTGMLDLGAINGGPDSRAAAINSAGWVTGWSSIGSVVEPIHAFLWRRAATGIEDLGNPLGDSLSLSTGNDINDAGVIAGDAGVSGPPSNNHAFAWTQATGIVDLGTFGPWSPIPGTRSYARVDAAKTTLDYAASPRFHP